ncbi:MAG: tRNA 2-thiouridine(34) synthase MnmA [Syntrophomonadaceae bacterium]|nr:tRNA 2-thiouridine(34) synthase MnmA [Syntrophomonadaceae bacterium]
MSGGVDSSVVALLLKEKGYDVGGLTMINWEKDVAKKAEQVAHSLGISHKTVDLRKDFYDKVISYFCTTYEEGGTPNPCVECNKYIKFGALLDIALELGYDMVATGHYARIDYDESRNRYLLKKGIDTGKDQSYFLYGLTQQQLSRTIFPLGDLTKPEVREIARQKGMLVVEKKESQEICFIAEDYRDFLVDKIKYNSGKVIDLDNNILGTHRGLPFYTIGQRKGLGISAGRPVYVVNMNTQDNLLILDDEKHLFSDNLVAINNNYIYTDKIEEPLKVTAKIRYRASFADAMIYPGNNMVRVEFEQPQRAITKGQSVVYYLGDYVLGGGIIAD